MKIEGFSVNSYYCRKSGNKGGVVILSKNELGSRHLTYSPSELCEDKVFEYCATKYIFRNFHVIIIGIYRSPNSDVNTFFKKLNILINDMMKKCTNIVIMGDININILQNSRETKELKNLLKSHGMVYLVDFPTRVCETTQTSIDNCLTNLPKKILTIEGIITHLSDHDAQVLEINTSETQNNLSNITCFKRHFSNDNKSLFLNLLSKESWCTVYNETVESKFDTFFNIFYYYFDISFPKTKTRLLKNSQGWINSDLIKNKNRILDYESHYRMSKDPQIKNLIKNEKKQYNSEINKTKQNYYNNMIKNSHNVCKTTWNIVNREINLKNTPLVNNISLSFNNILIENPETICNIFCDYYTNMVESKIIPSLDVAQSLEKIPFLSNDKNLSFIPRPITEEELDKLIIKLNNKYSTGYDEIPMPIIKCAKFYLLKPLTHIINSSFISGIFPERLKISKTKPLFKNGCSKNVENYRPLSLISSFSKLYEKVMVNQLVEFLEMNNLMDDDQHGFRVGRSVISAGIDFIESIIDSLDKSEKVVGVFMDLSKAFDSVCHKKLLDTLNNLGIKNRTLSWFESYLTDRKHFVEINHLNQYNQLTTTVSTLNTVKYGIPQGSILGPLLFLCYIKGLPNLNHFDKITLYADDINLKVSKLNYKDIEISSFCQLSSIQQYLAERNLLLNPIKTKYISFSLNNNKNNLLDSAICINDHTLIETNEVKFLGLTVDRQLNWNSHVDQICNRLASGIFALRKLSQICDTNTLKSVYFSLIHSHISFGIILYGSTTNKNLHKILIFQKQAVRIILNLDWFDSAKDSFQSLGILTVFSLYIFELILLVKRNFHSICALGDKHNYNTRFKKQPCFSTHNLKIFERKPSYAGIKYFNSLPPEIKNITDVNKFKSKLKLYLLNKPLYSLDEFFTPE